MSQTSNAITEKAEAVENYLEETNSRELSMERFYDICSFIQANNLLQDSAVVIARMFIDNRHILT